MPSLLKSILGQVGGDNLAQLSQSIGADRQATGNALSAALPVLLGALTRNAQSEEGARSLSKALDKDHDGALLDHLGSFLGGGDSKNGEGILRHVLGSKRESVERSLATSTGLDVSSVSKLLPKLAPVLMSALAKQKNAAGLDPEQLAGLLENERQELAKAQPQATGLLSGLLDKDGDGDVDLGDLKGMLGKLF